MSATSFALASTSQTLQKLGRQAKSFVFQRDHILAGLEIAFIIFWALLFAQPYLNMDPQAIPAGGEYKAIIQNNHLWSSFQKCGLCALWNGSTRGGAPAFVDPHGSALHPLVALTSLIAGVRNGAKLAMVAAFIIAGLGQWWLGWLLRVKPAARLWTALLAVVGGHLAGRMENGEFSLLLSSVFCALVFPAVILLLQRGSRKAAALLGVVLASAALSGQGYLQIGLVMIAPAAVFLIPWERLKLSILSRRLALALLVAFLLAAPFLVPYLHFLPQFTKDLDRNFDSTQSFEYVPLNLVIRDFEFLKSEQLSKYPYPYLYSAYIGWVAVILAVFSLLSARIGRQKREYRFLIAAAVLALWASSGNPYLWLVTTLPAGLADMVAGIRHPSLITSLAVPPILGLSAFGLDYLLRIEWPVLHSELSTAKPVRLAVSIDARWLLVIPLGFALWNVFSFSKTYLYTVNEDPNTAKVIQALKTNELQWVNPPFGVGDMVEPAVAAGLKMTYGWRAWNWKDRVIPYPILEASYGDPPPNMLTDHFVVAGVNIYSGPPSNQYAMVLLASGEMPVPCQATGRGANIYVDCSTSENGVLVVKENSWTGWKATLDGVRVPLKAGQWLSVDLPKGGHHLTFRYRPWDVPLGILLSLVGIGLVIYLARAKEPPCTGQFVADDTPAEVH